MLIKREISFLFLDHDNDIIVSMTFVISLIKWRATIFTMQKWHNQYFNNIYHSKVIINFTKTLNLLDFVLEILLLHAVTGRHKTFRDVTLFTDKVQAKHAHIF